jgi:lauroyl/myristoyl acyltransferase
LPLAAQLWLADAAAGIGWRLLPAMHNRVRENVRQVLGAQATDEDVDRVARLQWRNYLRYLRDFAAAEQEAPAEIERIFAAAEGWEHVISAMAAGKGAILASAHFGNWDLAAATMAREYPLNVIADTFAPASLDGLINRRRELLHLKVIPIEKALKRTVSAIRRGDAVAFLIDKPVAGDEGVEVRFFGRPVRIPAGAAFFSLRLGAPIIPAFVWRQPDREFAVRIFPPIWPQPSGDRARDIRDMMQRLMAHAETMIREQPACWYMFRSMWTDQTRDSGPRTQHSLEEAVA